MTESKNYKDTLNLPKTAFSMKANLPTREPQMLKKWDSMGLYDKRQQLSKGKTKFILHDGPPYANGDIHIGHAVNKILKDMIVKSKYLSGFDTPYVPGWDCHGLPIELQVEKKIGKAGVKVTPKVFRAECRKYAHKQISKQKVDFIRLGVLGDWDNPYLTLDYKTEANIVRGLAKIFSNNHIHQGFKPVHWCVDCGSALAEAEVEYQDKRSHAIDVRFPIQDDAAFISQLHHTESNIGSGPISVVIWTTTPWTLPANEAVCLNPNLDYVLVECSGNKGTERLLIAEALWKDAMGRYGFEEHRVVAYCTGQALENTKLQHPFYDKDVSIILGDHVTTEAGTGCVHTAPAHGQEDYAVGSRYNLPVVNPVGADGKFLADTPLFAGQHVFKANEQVMDELNRKGNLVHHQALNHSYPHCWRHKSPIIFRATPQWFISMEQNHLRDMANKNIPNISWIPSWGQARIEGMISSRPDWCISRQRTWGVPIAIFVHKDTQQFHPDTPALMEKVANKIETDGIDAWFDLETKDLIGDDAEYYEKISDTLDVWFDSGSTHYCVLSQRDDLGFPADLYLEGSDQHRGWFQSSLLASLAMNDTAPYKQVLTHGFTVDADGKKMSKSERNVVAPQKIVNSLGADIIRLWVSSIDYSAEMTVSDEIFKRTADAYRRIRNTARFFLANLNGFDPSSHLLNFNDLIELDKWAIQRTALLQEEIKEAYDNYEFHVIYQKIHNFCTVEMGSFYLDIIKDRQYTTQTKSIARHSAQTALFHIAHAFSRWISPILSFTADEVWQHIPGENSESIFLENWYTFPNLIESKTFSMDFWSELIELRVAVSKQLEKLRVAGQIGSSLDAEVKLYCGTEIKEKLSLLQNELRFALITSDAEVFPDSEKPSHANHVTLNNGDEIWIDAFVSSHKKCIRCWHHRDDTGSNSEHPDLCSRCIENVEGNGEKRKFV